MIKIKKYSLRYNDKVIISTMYKNKIIGNPKVQTKIYNGYKDFTKKLLEESSEGELYDFQADIRILLEIDKQYLEICDENKLNKKVLRYSIQTMYLRIAKKWRLIYDTNDFIYKK